MSRQDDIKRLLLNCNRRLQALKERKALYGLDTPVAVLTEIQDIEAEIEELQTRLKELELKSSHPETVSDDSMKNITITKRARGNLSWRWVSLGILILIMIVSGVIFFIINQTNRGINAQAVTTTVIAVTEQTEEANVTQSVGTITIKSPTDTPVISIGTPITQLPADTPLLSTDVPSPTPTKAYTVIPEITLLPSPLPTGTPTPLATTTAAKIVPVSSCPAWFATPEPGKAVLILENHYYREVRVGFSQFYNHPQQVIQISAKQANEPTRIVLQSNPGYYCSSEGNLSDPLPKFSIMISRDCPNISFEIQANQIWALPLFDYKEAGVQKPAPYPLEIPSGCSYP